MEYAIGPLRRYRGNTTWAAALPAALLMAFGGLLAGAHVSPSAAAGPPNIVFLLADDLDERVASGMPRLQELAQSGTRFSKFYVTTPICVPSRATILTGKYAQNTNVRRNTPPFGGYQTFFQDGLEGRTIAVALQQAGYRTGFVGKYFNGYPAPAAPNHVPPGWDYWVSAPQGDNNIHLKTNYFLNENGAIVSYGNRPEDYVVDVYARKALEFVNSSADQGRPFALFLWLPPPHTPERPAPRHADAAVAPELPRTPAYPETSVADKPRHMRLQPKSTTVLQQQDRRYRLRQQMVLSVDDALGSLRALLGQRGLLENTYVVFSSDNGWHHGEHNLPPYKGTGYEEDIRVPLVVAGPGVPAGREITRMVGNADLAPTFAAWTGAPLAPDADGRSLVGLLTSPSPDLFPWRGLLPIARLGDGVDPATTWPLYTPRPGVTVGYRCLSQVPRWPIPSDHTNRLPEWRGVRTDRYTYVQHVSGDRELYDSVTEPYQANNQICSAPADLRDGLQWLT
ncbi:MAG TPA: sulfatase, partial [Geminicoccaceae bacterium]|nr:sulfatase [Geminicoccaceae bacterium]